MPEMRRLSPAEAGAALAAWALEDPARSPWPIPIGHDSHMTGEDRPPQPAEPPDLITALTADTGDWEDASRYLLHQLRQPQMRRSTLTLHPSALPSRPPETASERVAGLLAHGGYVAPVQAISTPGPHEPGIYTVRPDAEAVTTLRHSLPSGGVRHLPLCGPCNLAEVSAPSVPN